MERSTNYPFSNGEHDIKLVVTGPIAEHVGAENNFDPIFGKAVSLITHQVVPSLNGLDQQVVVREGETTAETILEIEVLGNKIELTIRTKLTYEVSKELIRTWVAKIVTPDFVEFATRVITATALDAIVSDAESVTLKEHDTAPPVVGLLFG